MNGSIEQSIEEIFGDLDLSEYHDETRIEGKGVTFWLPMDYKIKYDMIQKCSKRKFSKKIKEIIMRSIDRVEIDSADHD